ncbi:MAG: hypothetical protein C4548_05460 [Desulfobacteraceae bacterium]|jgi:hypothetical protein|nr:MAG: hypothetical protein C4548_05460 [Desulfobacteraceae bacterium]
MHLHYDRHPVASIDNMLSYYGAKEFKSPTRSTVPLLSWLKHEPSSVCSLLNELGMPADYTLHLEYTVNPPKGKGQASHTDLMVLAGAGSLAIEAKWTEPRYETVSDWLNKGASPDNRLNVLTGWLHLLQTHSGNSFAPADFSGAVYQMVHRAAAACASGKSPRLAYLMFDPSPDPNTAEKQTILDDLNHLWNLLGSPRSFPFHLVNIDLASTAVFDQISVLLKNSDKTSQAVQRALLEERLFNFMGYVVTNIDGRVR